MKTLLLTSAAALLLANCTTVASTQSVSSNAMSSSGKTSGTAPGSYADGQRALANRLNARETGTRAKNVILFIGDGMGVSTVTAMRIYEGQKLGMAGEEYELAIDGLPHVALSKTYNTDQQVPDSAGTATAMMTGEKSRAGVLNISPAVARNDCANALNNPLTTLVEQASERGFQTGIVSTTRLTHATPAATFAQSPNRNWESAKDVPAEAAAQGCQSIAQQLIDSMKDGTVDLALGGGHKEFPAGFESALTGTFVTTKAELDTKGATGALPLLGLFSASHLDYMAEKPKDSAEPTLSDMTKAAISKLAPSGDGYVLMIEGGRIDHGHHDGKAQLALEDGVEFDNAVRTALNMVDLSETLIIVTADHSHVFSIAGYPTRGNPILGAVIGNDENGAPNSTPVLADDGLPYTTLGYQNGPGATQGVRNPDLSSGEIIRQVAAIPGRSETHGGEDVAIYAAGPSSALVSGVMEQNTIYHILRHALGF